MNLTQHIMTPEQIARRRQIEQIWRTIHGHDDSVELAGGKAEWLFFEALLLARPVKEA